jgi:cell division protein FtsI/penicillin-binding protein 2
MRLVFVQLVDHSHSLALSTNEVARKVVIPPLRGGIYDRHGNILAVSTPTSRVIADDFQIAHPKAEAAALSPFVHIPAAKLEALLSQRNGYVVLTNSLDVAAGHKLARQFFPGIVVVDSSQRAQPTGDIATATLGGINSSGEGSAGLEYQYNSLLAGVAGEERVYAAPSGVSLPSSHVKVIQRARPGVGLELTLDTSLQFVAEQAVAQQLKATGGLTGTAIVMDVRTGELLANVSLVNTKVPAGALGPTPSWRKSIGVPGIEQTINNLAVSQTYEPGSVFKIVPFSAALEAHLITPSQVFSVPYSTVIDGHVFHDAERHGLLRLTSTNILAQSSNIGTYQIARQVGESSLLAQVERLGFGQATSLNFPGETAGLLVDAARWSGSDIASLPIGQVDAVTPLQVLDAYNSIANGGTFVEPKLVRATIDQAGIAHTTPSSATRRALTGPTAATLTDMLKAVVVAGTGNNAVIPGYEVAGKTGTSQIPTPGHSSYITGAYNASFVGFAPANNPVLSMIVVIQRPQTTIFGGLVAAPVFQRVMTYALHHYGVPSTGFVAPTKGSATNIASDVT